MDFNTLSSKGKRLLRYQDKLYSKKLFARDDAGRIKTCYWACINKGCPGKVTYKVDPESNSDGMSVGIGDGILDEHDNEVCQTDEIEVLHGTARSDIMALASQGKRCLNVLVT